MTVVESDSRLVLMMANADAPALNRLTILLKLACGETAPLGPAAAPSRRGGRVLDAVDWTPTPTGDILRRTGLDLSAAAAELHALERVGLVAGGAGWWERRRPEGEAGRRADIARSGRQAR